MFISNYVVYLLQRKTKDMESFTVNYEGIEFEVVGIIDTADETTGYKEGFSWHEIYINGNSVSWMLKEDIINTIVEQINY